MAEPTVSLMPRCHCRKYDPVSVPSSAFPLDASACHCGICRRVSGTFCVHYNQLPAGVDIPASIVAKLKVYQTSKEVDRYFCGVCGAHIGIRTVYSPHYSFALGAIPASLPSGKPTSKLLEHIFVQPEDGGGLARYIDDGLPKYVGENDDDRADESQWTVTERAPAKVPLRCACGQFQAELVRPSAVLSIPPCEGDPLEHEWKDRVSDDKWRLGVCPCESCRLTIGFPFSAFVFILQDAIKPVAGSKGVAGLSKYLSREDVTRYFCGGCGASVLYELKSRSELGVLDLNAGVIDGPLGPILKEWLWRAHLATYGDDADDVAMFETLRRGWESSQVKSFV